MQAGSSGGVNGRSLEVDDDQRSKSSSQSQIDEEGRSGQAVDEADSASVKM